MASQNQTLQDLRLQALAMCGDIASDSRFGPTDSMPTGSLTDQWINEAQQIMASDFLGIEETIKQTTVVGKRDYPLPSNYIKIKLVYYNGTPLDYHPYVDEDFFSKGNTYCSRFSIWRTSLVIGPLPPSQIAPLVTHYWREPLLLVEDGDIPDVPNRFRGGLAAYAAAQMAVGDGELAQAKMLMERFEKTKQLFTEWIDGQTTQSLQVRDVTCGMWGYLY